MVADVADAVELRDDSKISPISLEDIDGSNLSLSDTIEGVKSSSVSPQQEEIYYEQYFRRDMNAINRRDTLFNSFLYAFINRFSEKEMQKAGIKKTFFVWVMIIFSLIVLFPVVYVVICLITNNISAWSLITVIVSSLIEIITAFLVLPQIIAEYLFNRQEDSDLIAIISNMQAYNVSSHQRVNNSHSDHGKPKPED